MQTSRSPTLDTVLMVEKTIQANSGEFTKRQLWQALPKKVMWQTFVLIIEYLVDINKIALDSRGTIAYIWNPSLAKQLKARRAIKV